MELNDSLTTLFRHNLWANLRLLEACAELTDEQLAAAIPGSRGSIRDTLSHITLSERHYFSRISTGQPYQRPENAKPLTLDDMMKSLRTTGEGLIEWASKVGDKDTVQLNWDGTPREVPKTIILTQVINHATEHREQVKAVMTDLGIEPPDLQSWSFFDEMDKVGA
jgi:uncharacterized damage-inducible protein DinB